MTSRDEAIRALEKGMRDECTSCCGPDVTHQIDEAIHAQTGGSES